MSDVDFSKLTDEERAHLDKALTVADGIQLYRRAGALGVGREHAPASNELARAGGLPVEQATHLARYRQWKQTTGGDSSWQGPINMNAGERDKPDTEEQINARRDAFLASSGDDRRKIVADQALANERAKEGHYDELVGDGPKPAASPPGEAIDKAKEFVKRNGRRGGKPMSVSDGDVLSKSMGRG